MSVNLGWAAGLFEGEGNISFTGKNSVVISLASTDKDVVERFQSIVGCGKIREYYKERRKPMFWWQVGKASEVEFALWMLKDQFGQRRKQKAEEAIERLKLVFRREDECAKGHAFSEDNTYRYPSGKRRCLICKREYERNR